MAREELPPGSDPPYNQPGWQWDSDKFVWYRDSSSPSTPTPAQSDDDRLIQEQLSGPFGGIVAPFANVPEIRPLIAEMARRGGDQSAWFTAQIRQTNWWKSHNALSQQWLVMSPAEQEQKIESRAAQIYDMYRQQGGQGWLAQHPEFSLANVTDPGDPLHYLAYRIESGELNWEAFQAQTYANMAHDPSTDLYVTEQTRQRNIQKERVAPRDLAEKLYLSAHGDYFVDVDRATATQYAEAISNGTMAQADWDNFIREQAASLYPKYQKDIMGGVTPGALFAPGISIMGRELEMSPDQVKADSVLWHQVASQAAAKGSDQAWTALDWTKFARSQPTWRYTKSANDMAASLASTITTQFGKVA